MADNTLRLDSADSCCAAPSARHADGFLWACGVLLLAWALALSIVPIWDWDTWFHLKLGEWMVAHRAVPHVNLFMYTTPNYPFVDHGWLSEVLFYLGYRVAGVPGLPVLIGVVVVASGIVLWRLWFRLGGSVDLAPVAFALALLTASTRFRLRHELLSFICVGVLLTVLYQYRSRSARLLWVLPILAVAWANLHGGWATGMVAMWIFVGGEGAALAIARLRGQRADGSRLRGLACWALTATAATLVNPYGYHWFEAVDPRRVRIHSLYITEWLPTIGGGGLPLYGGVMVAILLLPLVLSALTMAASGRRASISNLALLLFATVTALSAVRNLGLAAGICLPLLAVESRAAAEGRVGRALAGWGNLGHGKLRLVYRVLVVAGLIAGAMHLWWRGIVPEHRPGLGADMTLAPVGAVRFIKEVGLRGPMFNMYNQGSYLIWKLFPREKIFVDSINAYPLSWFQQYDDIVSGRQDVAEVVDRWKLRYVLLDRGYFPGGLGPFLDQLTRMGWRLVYYNGRDMIYVSDTPEHKELIARYAYRYLRPETVDAAAFRDHRAELRAEVARMIAGDPDSPSAHDAAAWVYARIGDPLGAERELQIEARLLRNPAPALLGLGQLYAEWGESARALDCFRRAARLSPRDAMVHRALADLYQSEGRFREAVAERRRVIGLEPSGSRGRFDLARTYRAQALQSGDADERLLRKAIAELRTALRVDPQAAIAYALGSVYLDLDEPRPAILAFKQGIALDRTLPANYRGLAVAQEGVGDRQAAIEAWRDVLTHAPDPETAALARERLRVLSGS